MVCDRSSWRPREDLTRSDAPLAPLKVRRSTTSRLLALPAMKPDADMRRLIDFCASSRKLCPAHNLWSRYVTLLMKAAVLFALITWPASAQVARLEGHSVAS